MNTWMQKAALFALARLPERVMWWVERRGLRVEVDLPGFDENRIMVFSTARRLDARLVRVRRI
jgi:hypothetical protein